MFVRPRTFFYGIGCALVGGVVVLKIAEWQRPVILAQITEDGSITIAEEIFNDPEPLRAKLETLQPGLFPPSLALWASDTVLPEQVESAKRLVESAGGSFDGTVMTVGFITEPRSRDTAGGGANPAPQ